MRSRLPLLKDLPVEVAVLASIAFFVALGFGIVIPSIPIFADSFGVSALAASAVVSAFALMRFVSSPFAGSWTNRFGERNVLAAGALPLSTLLGGCSSAGAPEPDAGSAAPSRAAVTVTHQAPRPGRPKRG